MRVVKYRTVVCQTSPSSNYITNLEIGITDYIKNNPNDYDILQFYCQEIKFLYVYNLLHQEYEENCTLRRILL